MADPIADRRPTSINAARVQVLDERGSNSNAADQLALDEAILHAAGQQAIGWLRIWEFRKTTIVLGRSSRHQQEVDAAACEAAGIPVLRRCTGGATIVGGPGCLMYSIALPIDAHPELAKINCCHDFVMARVRAAAARQFADVRIDGICDLVWRGRKVGGNAMRLTRDAMLYHGTVLYAMDFQHWNRWLQFAPRQPDYRGGRDHESFVGNLPIDSNQLRADLCEAFAVTGTRNAEDFSVEVSRHSAERYSQTSWHFRH
ncbi:MAG: lipoate--protein ligase family protein [Planctomycetota bacterium]